MAEASERITRRLFNAHLVAATTGAALPWRPAGAQPGAGPASAAFRIAALTLKTSQPLDLMKRFYTETIGFPLAAEGERSFTIACGASALTFEHAPGVHAFYHFAFNIPENRILEAYAFQRERTEFILPPERLNDAGMPRAVVAFRHWDAHSVFFWDPAGNAVEYIARHTLRNAATRRRAFSPREALCLSEIGLVVDDVPAAARLVKRAVDADTYVSASQAFEPIGSEHGLLLMMRRGAPMAFDQGGRRDVYPTRVELERDAALRLSLQDYPYTLVAAGRQVGPAR